MSAKNGRDVYVKEKLPRTNNQWRLENPEKSKAIRNRWREKNIEHVRNYSRAEAFKRKFGITIFDYDEIFKKQNGVCAICGRPQSEFKRKFSLDHCHKTLKVRGLLCSTCNSGIGFFDDDIERIENAIKYLIEYKDEILTEE